MIVAVIANDPRDVGFAIDDSVSYAKMTEGALDDASDYGMSPLIEDYAFFSVIPVDVFNHDTRHFITIRAFEGLNNKMASHTIPINIDKVLTQRLHCKSRWLQRFHYFRRIHCQLHFRPLF